MSPWSVAVYHAHRDGYELSHPWEGRLKEHLERFFPALVEGLQASNDLYAYVVVKVAGALNLVKHLEAEGAEPERARELALEQLLPSP